MATWAGELSPRVSVLAVAASMQLLVGKFRCPVGDPAWNEINHIGDVAHVVFPRTAVAITPAGAPTIAADANRIVLYDAGQEYRRAPLDPRGDDCVFVALGDDLLAEIGGSNPVVDPRRRGFATRERNCPPSTYASLQLLRSVPARASHDPLASDELLLQLTCEALAGTGVEGRDPLDPLADEVRAVLAACYHERLTLADVATVVGVSPYHLHRRFRAATGWTIHAYRDHLRLREGLGRMLDGADDIAAVADDLGYASHSHFTDRFRRAFGVTPSSARGDGPTAIRGFGR